MLAQTRKQFESDLIVDIVVASMIQLKAKGEEMSTTTYSEIAASSAPAGSSGSTVAGQKAVDAYRPLSRNLHCATNPETRKLS